MLHLDSAVHFSREKELYARVEHYAADGVAVLGVVVVVAAAGDGVAGAVI